MRFAIIAALAFPLMFGAATAVNANDAHHPEKQAKAKSPQKKGAAQKRVEKAVKKAVKKPVKQTPEKKSGSSS